MIMKGQREMLESLKNWLEIRIGINEIIRQQLTEYRMPEHINFLYTLGAVALFAFVFQVITGLLLLIYYIPHAEHAFKSIQVIMTEVPFGWLFRLMHVVGSNLMLVVVFLHMFSVFFMGSYKKPRELTWVSGALLLLLTLSFCLSGYLLPWSQLSYWATTIVTAIPTAFPYVGSAIAEILSGGRHVSDMTLRRFFAFHVGVIPFFYTLLLGLHIFLIRRIGVSTPPSGRLGEKKSSWSGYRHENHPSGPPFYPHFVIKEAMAAMVYFAAMFFIIAFVPELFSHETANIPADPFRTPAHIKPEWYFLAAYQMLKTIPNKFIGIVLQLTLLSLFLFWPFFDTSEERNILKRPLLFVMFIFFIIIWTAFTVWGKYS